MDFIESKGKTVDEAVFNGLLKMDLSIDEVEIEILEEGGGLFKSARVRMIKKPEQPEEVLSVREEIKPPYTEHRKEDGFLRRDDRGYRRDEFPRRRSDEFGSYKRDGFANQKREYADGEPFEKQEPKNSAEKFLIGIFEHMGINVRFSSEQTGDMIKVDMSGRAMGMLIGRRGETLDALQYLTSLVVNNGKEDYQKVMLDTENYRKKREEALIKLAASLADRVIRSGKRVVLEPMNPYERRILHATLQDNKRVTTFSEGEEPFRSVVVALKGRENESEVQTE